MHVVFILYAPTGRHSIFKSICKSKALYLPLGHVTNDTWENFSSTFSKMFRMKEGIRNWDLSQIRDGLINNLFKIFTHDSIKGQPFELT